MHEAEVEPAHTKLSILHICAPAHVGGLERVVQGLAIGSAEHGHRVGVLSVAEPATDTSAFFDPLERAPIETFPFEVGRRSYLKEWRLVRDVIRSFEPDVVHTHGYRSDLLHGGSARRLGAASVSTLHGSSRMGGVSHAFEWVQLKALARFDGVVAVSRPLVGFLVDNGVPSTRVHNIPNAWAPPDSPLSRASAREVLQANGQEVIVGFVGRLIPIKGCDILLRALGEMGERGWGARIIGDGPSRASLEALARDLGLSDRVRFLGAIPDAARLFAGLDLFVLSSRSEGTPMVLLEAMGAGVPVVSTAVGGVPDVLRSPAEGWVVPPEDPSALAAALKEAVGDRAGRQARASRGSARIESEFDASSWVLRHERLYGEAISVRRSLQVERLS